MARDSHARSNPPFRAGVALVIFLAVLVWYGAGKQDTVADPQGATSPLSVQDAISAGVTSATAEPTATWHGPVVTATSAAPAQAGPLAPTPGAPSALFPAANPVADVASVGLADIADGSGSDGTLRRIAVPILMYHYVSVPPEDADVYRRDLSVTPERFRAQMRYLAEHGYNVISLYDLNLALRWGAPLPPRPVILTFDDGYRDNYENAFPILQEFGYTATFFVITSRLDEGHPSYLSWAQAREMVRSGMSIESHTKSHVDLRRRSPEFLYYQIQGSIESIEAHTQHRPRLFCYPAGRWDETVLASLRALGLWAAVTTEGGIEHTSDETLLMRRVRISGDTDLATFAVLLDWGWDRSDS